MPRKQIILFLSCTFLSVILDYRRLSPVSLPESPQEWGLYAGVLVFSALLFQTGRRFALPLAALAGAGVLGLDDHLSNHETLYAVIAATLAVAWALEVGRARSFGVDLGRLHERLAPVLRLEFLVFYFWVAFHKLNSDFLGSDDSCAIHLLERLSISLPGLPIPSGLASWAGPLTLMAEVSVPLLLVARRTRRFGVLLGGAFHTLLAPGFSAFQVLVLGFLALFVPEADWRSAAARVPVSPSLRAWCARPAVRTALGLAVGAAASTFFQLTHGAAFVPVRWWGQGVYAAAALAACGAATLLYAWLVLPHAVRPAPHLDLWPRQAPWMAVFPLLVLVQGTLPYLGVKNVQVFAMFSNLDTEAAQSNHLLVPAFWQLSTNLSDPVFIHEGSDPRLLALGTRAALYRNVLRAAELPVLAVPNVQLRRTVTRLARSGVQGLRLDYSRAGVRRVLERAEADPALAGAGWLERTFLVTRPIAIVHHGACRW